VIGFSRPVYNAGHDEALVWVVYLDVLPAHFGGPAVVPQDTVLRFERRNDRWTIARVYAFSPD